MIYKAHGATRDDWTCPEGCEPQELSGGWVHRWDCPFWNLWGDTPF